jgi:hypothetical protein
MKRQRLGRQSAHCKLGTALGLAGILVMALSANKTSLLWAAAPLALLALADAGYAAQARRIAEYGRRLNEQKDSVRPSDLMQLQAWSGAKHSHGISFRRSGVAGQTFRLPVRQKSDAPALRKSPVAGCGPVWDQ